MKEVCMESESRLLNNEQKMLFATILLNLFRITIENMTTQNALWNDNMLLDQKILYKSSSICKELVNCSCYRYGNFIAISCIELRDIDQMLRFLQLRFRSSKITRIYISKSFISHLPPRAFQNLFIKKLFIKNSVVNNVSDDVFVGIAGLVELQLDNFNLSTLPRSVGKLNKTIRKLIMMHGGLSCIKKTLQNCTKMQVLSFKDNKIAYIEPSDFLHMTGLLYLDISNNTIIWLDPMIFDSLSQLQYLDLTGNQLRTTEGFFNKSQFNLQELKLAGNNISDVDKISLNPLYSLSLLTLADNPLKVIKKESFINLPALRTLQMQNCSLKSISPIAFQFAFHIFYLDIGNNQLSTLDKNTFINVRSIKSLYLSDNQLETLDGFFLFMEEIQYIYADRNNVKELNITCFKNAKRLKMLYLGGNLLTCIRKDTFVNNKYLSHLQLTANRINCLEPDAFRGLYQLQYLSLSQNKLFTLNESINNLPLLEILELNHNYLTMLDASCFRNVPSLHFLNIAYNFLMSVEGAFVSLRNLNNLRLQNNSLKVFRQQSLSSAARLRNLTISGNPLACNCLLEWLVKLNVEKNITIDNAQCKNPEWLENRFLRNLSIEDVKYWPEECPQECKCRCMANFTDYYIGVHCANLRLRTAPEILPNKTGYLDLSSNQIDNIRQSMFYNLTQLEYLLLHQNNLTLVPDCRFNKLRTLTLAGNRLTRFPVSNVDSTYLEHVTLSENPWICDCQILDFRKWLLANKMAVSDVNATKCDNTEVNGSLRNRVIISLSEFRLCSYLIAIYASICIGILGFLLLVAGGKITYNRYRLNIKIWMYTRGICSCLSCVKEEDLDEGKEFDAFISYSSADETFVVRTLVPMLESGDKPYLLCLHYRQFPPGAYIQDNIMQAVKISKRTILVLSKNFLQSEWCRLEFKSAHHQVLEERLNRLVVIILGELPPKEEIDPEIMMYLASTTYLTWGERNFWNKLKYAMPKTPFLVTEEEKAKLLN